MPVLLPVLPKKIEAKNIFLSPGPLHNVYIRAIWRLLTASLLTPRPLWAALSIYRHMCDSVKYVQGYVHLCIYIYIYIYMCVCVCVCVCGIAPP